MFINVAVAATTSGEVLTAAASGTTQIVSNVADFTSEAQSFFNNLDWSKPSWDLFIILFFLAASLIYGLSMGRDRAIVVIVSIYMALAVVDYAPFAENLIKGTAIEQFFLFKITSFVAVFILLFYLLAQSALLNTIASRSATRSWWQAILFSFLQVGLLISIVLSFLPAQSLAVFSGFTQKIFMTDSARFVWIIMPIILMALIKKPKRGRRHEIDEYL
ncbi:MAG: hypothetical protein UV78_C0075G0006 [Parcubacteria group bacterium GW2011_GWA2_43_17]|nr:MAG: hypothetical protein UV78_C0075G0006 [Parcubacteria group bacterium GW2011_GWA2_43_17]KKT91012.1 MAG: hypothetical protein UW91_C0040G0012 [Parcubacteria group bacterium GW2011_GWF2_45_11]OGY93182.1 MAG: hypothetical protein A2260_01920 [Candidatus Komeilibacteria bacterium RIFOXYA2_FULL_45_9]HAH04186.1 hypothetical protein [Candidatus Komeilibacteria bacterium]HCC73220.1 hypothetical protein [Candidatus Komeilibacteria bacterium]